MEGGLLSLKWNNHKSTFFSVLCNVRKKKDSYSDATLACDGKFYPVHKLVLSSCSDYFEEMFDQAGQAQCKHPFIVLKDIKSDELECLLSYMYVGEVNVVQEKLAGLIKAAECLRIKGLAVPDEEPSNSSNKSSREKRQCDNSVNSEPKRRKPEVSPSNANSSSVIMKQNYINDERRKFQDPMPIEKTGVTTSFKEELYKHKQDSIIEDIQESAIKNEQQDVLIDDTSAATVKTEPAESSDDCHPEPNLQSQHMEQFLTENYIDDNGDNQQHFMDELLGNSSDSRQMSSMNEFLDGGESSGSAGGVAQDQPLLLSKNSLSKVKSQRKKNNKHPCPYCGLMCFSPSHWKRHVMIHTGEKPLACPHCPYRTRQSSDLKSHIFCQHARPLQGSAPQLNSPKYT